MTTAAQPSQAKKPQLTYSEGITFDRLARIFGNVFLRPAAVVYLPAFIYLYDRFRVSASPDAYPVPSLSLLTNLFFGKAAPYRFWGYLVAFGFVRNLHRALSRHARNHGEWRQDRAQWDKELVVITGGATGIGKCVVERLSHKHKAAIAVLDMAPPTYAPAPPGAPKILYIKTDVSSKEAVASAAAQIKKTFGRHPTFLLNCAGIGSGTTILDADEATTTKVWRVNTLANWVTAQQFLPYMISHNHGHVFTVASSASYMSLPQMAQYASSKAAALAFHEVLHGEIRSRYKAPRVRASVFLPTKVATALGEGMEDQPDPFFTPTLSPIQCAEWIVDSFDRGLSEHIIAPSFMSMLPWMRVVPPYMRRHFEIIGGTDNQVNDGSIQRAISKGYGKWEADEAAALEKAKAGVKSVTNGSS
ncbi:unnamed protein product [Tilletia laevis]|uniref:Short-chain dehydrogenase/reductase 3 n=3 Tax=Tilletia TaxID=13289 RepID=A0A8X7MXQ2_9BASI|nr:hypothetical protein CF336_g6071 [Tilletia laevis]KAE8191657.1 hypothetical protein CF328_g5609 [Tilletia controversa]KAE8256467.1 hypothetical protein A4X03_0g5377 [Tilletia caries]KAE8194545.1 hypothetical protein CF335_g5322 [Tilletia laevis]KAE8252168.1 hypothetical protein A4X06_0g2383 [Tilletia controversa]